jgi:hypothetical protein
MRTPEEKKKHAEYMREYNRTNSEKISVQRKERYKKKIESDPEYRKQLNKLGREGYYRNKEDRDQWQRDYHTEHPLAKAVYRANWFSKKAGIFGKLVLEEVETLFKEQNFACTYCGKRPVKSLDHIIPFINGGQNTIDNITPCCPHCNISKKDRSVEAWQNSQERRASKKTRPKHGRFPENLNKNMTFRSDTHKQCTKCRLIKPRSEFRERTRPRGDPSDTRCKECRKIEETKKFDKY